MLEIPISPCITVYCSEIDNTDAIRRPTRREREKSVVDKIIARIFGNDARLDHHPDGAPFIRGIDVAVSVSHSLTTAAVAVNCGPEAIGIDVESYRPQLSRVATRIFSAEELDYYSRSERLLLSGWTLKEAVYKAARTPGLDFREDIRLGIPREMAASAPGSIYIPCFHDLPGGDLLTIVKGE